MRPSPVVKFADDIPEELLGLAIVEECLSSRGAPYKYEKAENAIHLHSGDHRRSSLAGWAI